jgi:hypothetical protein
MFRHRGQDSAHYEATGRRCFNNATIKGLDFNFLFSAHGQKSVRELSVTAQAINPRDQELGDLPAFDVVDQLKNPRPVVLSAAD